jgi:putative endonuclease
VSSYYFYLLANRPKGVLYAGATSDLARRMAEHKGRSIPSFTSKHGVTLLVYFEEFPSINEARAREYSVKRWRREWKFKLIEQLNPAWDDLTDKLAL